MKYNFQSLNIGEFLTFAEDDKQKIYSAASHAGRRQGKKFKVDTKRLICLRTR